MDCGGTQEETRSDDFPPNEDSSTKISRSLKSLKFSNPGSKFSTHVVGGKRKPRSTTRFDLNINQPMYNDKGILLPTGQDICDCLRNNCPGCHFECKLCKSTKCGSKCRTNRTWYYEKVEVEGLSVSLEMNHVP